MKKVKVLELCRKAAASGAAHLRVAKQYMAAAGGSLRNALYVTAPRDVMAEERRQAVNSDWLLVEAREIVNHQQGGRAITEKFLSGAVRRGDTSHITAAEIHQSLFDSDRASALRATAPRRTQG